MKYKKYPKYKDSGVEWIGEIPEGWEVVRLKHNYAQVIAGQSPPSSSYVDNGRGIQFLQGCETFGDLHPDSKISTIEPTKIVQQNTVLISVRAPVGTLNIANSEICIGRGLAGIVVKENNLSYKFLYYFLNLSSKIISGGSRGTTFQSIRTEELENSLIVSMPYDEQSQISEFLDKKTTQFDELINKSKKQ
ncbi:MAG: restriction endonuclease subunit S, partial [Dehalococcoidaceae bacterium]|nr:restriction endonuclease subunit S [Dehalococcoidaceae bacterium]